MAKEKLARRCWAGDRFLYENAHCPELSALHTLVVDKWNKTKAGKKVEGLGSSSSAAGGWGQFPSASMLLVDTIYACDLLYAMSRIKDQSY